VASVKHRARPTKAIGGGYMAEKAVESYDGWS
jgi:hypothetical protein